MAVIQPNHGIRNTIFLYAWLGAIVLTLLVAISFFWNIQNLEQQIILLAEREARSNWNKDLAFRKWATRHGGVYVKPDERTPPNPYLKHVPDHDVKTTSGMDLTLMNPAYMMSQMSREFEKLYGIKGKITSQILMNPNNKADPWEMEALKKFDQGVKEVLKQTEIDGKPYIRFMRPMIIVEGCLKCHGLLGYKVGDIRGGVSISIPLDTYFQAAQGNRTALLFSHVSLWLIGIAAIVILTWRGLIREQDRVRIEELIRLRENQLIQADKMTSLGILVSGVAHEINNPNNFIMVNAPLLSKIWDDVVPILNQHHAEHGDFKLATLSYEKAEEVVPQLLSGINNGTERIRNIVANLRDFSHQDASREISPVNINDVLASTVVLISSQINKSTRNFSIEYEQEIPSFLGDFQRMEQVAINLISNACQALTDMENAIHVQTKYDPKEQLIQLIVTDEGRGIPQENLGKILDPFFTTNRDFGGTGLGLSVSFSIIVEHQGSLDYFSTEGEGATFIVSLPAISPV